MLLQQPGKRGVFHVTGANLGLVIEVLLTDETITREYLEGAIEAARSTMRIVDEEEPQSPQEDSADDFFA